jgi:hypothetical protein
MAALQQVQSLQETYRCAAAGLVIVKLLKLLGTLGYSSVTAAASLHCSLRCHVCHSQEPTKL